MSLKIMQAALPKLCTLKAGDCFKYDGIYYQKVELSDVAKMGLREGPIVLNLVAHTIHTWCEDTEVLPVELSDLEIIEPAKEPTDEGS